MGYSELIKDYNRIREYMRQFYVYGFRTRDEYDAKSARSYDNERRRVESWLGKYMSFRQEPAGRVSFISVDTSELNGNPLYNAFKAKSFTANDIVLNFVILDILQPGEEYSVSEITDMIDEIYMSVFDDMKYFDEATVRNKLKEYVAIGILSSERKGRSVVFRRAEDQVALDKWENAIAFYSEAAPTGVIGSFLLDKLDERPDIFSFRQHFILHALESDIVCTLLDAITDRCIVDLAVESKRKQKLMKYRVIPLKICISTENGRSYLLGREKKYGHLNMYRLDRIDSVIKEGPADDYEEISTQADEYVRYLWNASGNDNQEIEHLEIILDPGGSDSLVQRLYSEGKHGKTEKIGENRYRFSIDVYDPTEMIPWLRTFIGSIESMECSDPEVIKHFYDDLDSMYEMYEAGDEDAV